MGKENLRSLGSVSAEERRAIGAAGGKKRGERMRQLKELREYVREFGLLDVDVKDLNGSDAKIPALGAVVLSMYRKAIFKGNIQAAEFIARLAGTYDDKAPVNAGFVIQVTTPQLAAELEKATR